MTEARAISDGRLREILAAAEVLHREEWGFVDSDEDNRILIVRAPNDAVVASSEDYKRASFIADCQPSTVAAMAEELMAMREAVNGDSPRTDDIAAASVLYQCADCVRAEADYSCHRREDVFVIGREVICRDCADAGHAGEQRRVVPDIPAKLKRQRMAISDLSKGHTTHAK